MSYQGICSSIGFIMRIVLIALAIIIPIGGFIYYLSVYCMTPEQRTKLEMGCVKEVHLSDAECSALSNESLLKLEAKSRERAERKAKQFGESK